MNLYLYKIGSSVPVLTIENAVSYTAEQVVTEEGAVYGPFAEDCELSSLPDCSETLRADWRSAQKPQDIPLSLCPGVTALAGGSNSYRRGADSLVVVNVAITATAASSMRVAVLPAGYRPAAIVSTGDIAVRPDGSVWANGSMTGSVCFYAPV